MQNFHRVQHRFSKIENVFRAKMKQYLFKWFNNFKLRLDGFVFRS